MTAAQRAAAQAQAQFPPTLPETSPQSPEEALKARQRELAQTSDQNGQDQPPVNAEDKTPEPVKPAASDQGASDSSEGEPLFAAAPPHLRPLMETAMGYIADKLAMNRVTLDDAKVMLREEIDRILDEDALRQSVLLFQSGTRPGTQALLSESSAPEIDDSEDEEIMMVDVLVDGDYVQKPMTRGQFLEMMEEQDRVGFDMLALDPAFSQGDNGRFDYYWNAMDDRAMLAGKAEGYVPVPSKAVPPHALGVIDRNEDGFIQRGDLVLTRRPKMYAPFYDERKRKLQEQMLGKAGDEARNLAEVYKGRLVFDEGEVKEEWVEEEAKRPNSKPQGTAKDREAEMRDREIVAHKGKKSFVFEENPVYARKVERARRELAGTR